MIKIERGSDPFKKYWWVLLVVFGAGGAAVCLPGLSGSGGASDGAAQVSEDGLRAADGSSSSLDPALNPAGAPGGAINLAMDGSGRRPGVDALASSLYQAPEPDAAPTAAQAEAASAAAGAQADAPKRGLADALREISRRGAAGADASGWGGRKAQSGFSASGSGALGGKANFGGLSGLGGGSSASSARLSASSGYAGGSYASSGGRVGITSTRGLQDDGKADGETKVRSFNNLRNVNKNMVNAARTGDLGAALAMGGRSFDGGGAGGAIGLSRGDAQGAVSAGLTAAPANLKVNDPDANSFKFEPVPLSKEPTVDPDAQRKQLIKMLVTAAVVGVVGMALGGAGAMLAGPIMTAINQSMTPPDTGNADRLKNNFGVNR